MRTNHDDVCLWWKDWHSCSCGFLEEELRNERRRSIQNHMLHQQSRDCEDCLEIIPNTFAVCGEYYGDKRQYCSRTCLEKNEGTK